MTTETLGHPPEQARTTSLWGHQPLRLHHCLNELSAFSRSAIADLIDRYPRSHCSLTLMSESDRCGVSRKGDIGGLSGEAVLDAIERGRMRLELRNVDELDGGCFKVVEQLVGQIGERVPGFSPSEFFCDLSISSPGVQIGYRSDPRGQLLWQLIGHRRVYVWPPNEPFVTAQHLEDTALFDGEAAIPYAPWYDAHAKVLDLDPGQMLGWPLNAPYRIENLGGLNVALIVSFSDTNIRRLRHVNAANGLLRHRFGYAAKSRSIKGPGYWSKAVFQKALGTGTLRRDERSKRCFADFRLDAGNPGAIVDLASAE